MASDVVAQAQGLLGLTVGGPFTADALNAVVQQVNAASQGDQSKLAAAAGVLLSYALYADKPTEATVEGDTATVKLQAQPLELALVLKDGKWQVDLEKTLQGMPFAARKNASLLLPALFSAPAEAPAAAKTTPAEIPAVDPVMELTDSSFVTKVEQAQGLVMVDFSATWCGPCQAMKPIFHQFAAQYQDRVKFGAVDTDASPNIARKYQIEAIPTVMVFQDGKQVAQHVGYCNAEMLQAMVEPFLQ